MTEIFTEEHREYVNKQITKALKTIDYGKMYEPQLKESLKIYTKNADCNRILKIWLHK